MMLVLSVLAVSCLPAQPNVDREELYRRYLEFPSYSLSSFIQPIWMGDGDRFCYSRELASGRQFFLVDSANNTQEPVFDVPRLRAALAELLPGDSLPEGVPFEEFVFVQDDRAIHFNWNGTRYLLSLDAYSLERLPPEPPKLEPRIILGKQNWPTMEELSPDGEWYLGIEDFNLYLRSTRNGQVRKITVDGIDDFEWELVGFPGPSVLRSPDGRLLAAKKTDYRETPKIPLVNYLDPDHSTQWIPYPTGFDRRQTYHLYLIDLSSGELITVEGAHQPEHWLLILQWSQDSRQLYFVRVDRYFKKLELLVADASTGSSRVILTEEADTSHLKGHPERETLFTPLEDGERFIWLSERDGWRHLYLYRVDGRLVTQLTRGRSPVERLVEVDEEREWVYFSAHGDPQRPSDTHLYRVNLQGQELTQLTEAPGQHDPRGLFGVGNPAHQIRFSPSQRYFLDTHSTPVRPHTVELRSADGTLVRTLVAPELMLPAELRWRPPEEFSATGADGSTPLEGILYRPFDFDPGKRYPVIAFVYGFAGIVPRTFDSNLMGISVQALAQMGFVTFVLERGALHGDKALRDVAYGRIGEVEVKDHVAALKQLAAERPYLDLGRVGVYGGSFGGYTAIHAFLTEPDIFKVAVAVAPITDMGRHDGNEVLLGPPESNPQAYEYPSNIRLAGNLKGKLLLIHGTHDNAVPLSHTLRMVDALIKADKPFDLLIMPGETHGSQELWSGYGNRAVVRYFIEHLQTR
jgi:dipeptidyl aminopeptidase/acylaminoacyl peptidase